VMNTNSAPVAENLEFATYKNISITENLSAKDPEGDTVTFEITREPKKGIVEVNDEGEFTYTPLENKKGKDSFSYTAKDSAGNISQPATVSIKIKTQTTDICYADLKNSDCRYDAICLAEKGVFVGEKLGNEYFFQPDAEITRGEFLSMCLNICDVEILDDINKTGFYDDSEIPQWSKPYIATALMSGIVHGYEDSDSNVVFSANSPISYKEAAVILNNTLNITDVNTDTVFNESYPSWAVQAMSNLISCDVIERTGAETKDVLTRADAAKMLVSALDVLQNRSISTSTKF